MVLYKHQSIEVDEYDIADAIDDQQVDFMEIIHELITRNTDYSSAERTQRKLVYTIDVLTDNCVGKTQEIKVAKFLKELSDKIYERAGIEEV